MTEQKSKRRCTFWLFISILHLLLEKCKTEKWNGCYGLEYKPMNSTNNCYKLSEPMRALDAWGYCNTITLMNSSQVMEFKEELKTNGLWVSAETYEYFRNKSLAYPTERPLHACYALDNALNPTIEDCYGKKLTQVCWREKFFARRYDASAPCGVERAVSLPPFPGCFEEARNGTCPPRTRLQLRGRYSNAMELQVVEYEERGVRFTKEDEPIENTTLFCQVRLVKDIPNVRLELRNNETAGGLTLWVGNSARAVWPPLCHSGPVVNSSDHTAVLVNVSDTTLPYFWCFVRDIFDQTAITSNRIFSNPRQVNGTCPEFGSKDMNLEKLLNENQLCTNCLRKALSLCDVTSNCNHNCGDEGCKNILERQKYVEKMFPKRIADWTDDTDCGAKSLWWLTEGEGDCNGDGIEDCDDNLARLLNPSCHPSLPDMRSLPVGEVYWQCRTNWTAEISRATSTPKTPFCIKSLHKGSTYFPLFVDSIPTYETKYLDCIKKDFIPEDSLTELNRLAGNNETLSMEVTEIMANNISSLMKLNEKDLERARDIANVSSLLELIDNVLLLAPQGINIIKENVLLSKASGDIIGVKVLTIEQSSGSMGGDAGKLRVQKNITKEKEIEKVLDKLEAAVVIPNRPKDTSIVTVISAGGSAFVSSGKENPSYPGRYEYPAQNTNNLIPAKNQPPNSENENSTHTAYRPRNPDVAIEYGCINSLVVGVSLEKNGVYVPLPPGEKVRIVFRTNILLLPGQTKRCVYLKVDEGIWKSDGCRLLHDIDNPNLETCECDHLTHFAQLVTDGDFISDTHAQVLQCLSIFSCFFSIFGLGGVISAGIIGKKWREKSENKVLVNLCVAVAASLGLFLWSALSLKATSTDWCEAPSTKCRAAGVLLHYLVLAGFCWMLVAAVTHYLRLTRLTGVGDCSRFVLKASLVGWGAPLVPVGALLATHADAYAGKSRDFCYPSGTAFYCAVLAPVCLVLLLNAALFGAILHRLCPMCRCCALQGSEGPSLTRWGVSERRLQVRMTLICVAFTFLFGFTWYLGLLSYHLFPAYIFCVAQALQGPALFVFFVLGEENVRRKLISFFRRIKKSETSSTMELNMCPEESSVFCVGSGEEQQCKNQTISSKEKAQKSRVKTEPSRIHIQGVIQPMQPPRDQMKSSEDRAQPSRNQTQTCRDQAQPSVTQVDKLKHGTQTSRVSPHSSEDQTQLLRGRRGQPNVQIQPPNVQPGYALLANCAVQFRKIKTSHIPNLFR